MITTVLQTGLWESANQLIELVWLKQYVPLWFALLMAFTKPYMWAKYAKDAVNKVLNVNNDSETET